VCPARVRFEMSDTFKVGDLVRHMDDLRTLLRVIRVDEDRVYVKEVTDDGNIVTTPVTWYFDEHLMPNKVYLKSEEFWKKPFRIGDYVWLRSEKGRFVVISVEWDNQSFRVKSDTCNWGCLVTYPYAIITRRVSPKRK
jgi:hypothetical protein